MEFSGVGFRLSQVATIERRADARPLKRLKAVLPRKRGGIEWKQRNPPGGGQAHVQRNRKRRASASGLHTVSLLSPAHRAWTVPDQVGIAFRDLRGAVDDGVLSGLRAPPAISRAWEEKGIRIGERAVRLPVESVSVAFAVGEAA